MQGGSTLQFSAIPLNLSRPDQGQTCDYLATGIWSKKSAEEASKCYDFCEQGPSSVKMHSFDQQQLVDAMYDETKKIRLSENSQFIYYCDNETVNGLEFQSVPPQELLHPEDRSRARWVCDMSSNFLTRKFDISKFDLVYSCAQKNFGVAGLTVVIVKKSILGKAPKWTPSLLDFKILADGKSLQNTPTTFSIYVADLVFDWMKNEGGVEEMSNRCLERSSKVYQYVDGEGSGFYVNRIPKEMRSRVNIVILIVAHGDDKNKNQALESKFVKQATERGLVGLEGHRLVGGIRASLYSKCILIQTLTK
jgi:phosphoserine aminotransferase